MKHSSELIDDFLDGELADERIRELGDWMGERDKHVREFVTRSVIHSLLSDYMKQREVQADALLRVLSTSRGNTRATVAQAAKPAKGPPIGPHGKLRRSFLAAAGILMTLTLGALLHQAMRPKVVAM